MVRRSLCVSEKISLTVQAHYLQGSSTPEPCWTLLGTASRMAIALGLHQAPKHRGPYAKAEREEGGRAWWLSYVMEKYAAC